METLKSNMADHPWSETGTLMIRQRAAQENKVEGICSYTLFR